MVSAISGVGLVTGFHCPAIIYGVSQIQICRPKGGSRSSEASKKLTELKNGGGLRKERVASSSNKVARWWRYFGVRQSGDESDLR